MRLPLLKTELRQLARLAGPLAAAQAGTQVMNLVDLAVLGRLGARELAAAGLGSAIFFTISVIGFGLVFGVDPLISQAFGAGLLLWFIWRAARGHFGPEYYGPVEIMGLYWHFVDIVWIFLFPFLYLIHSAGGHHG